MAGEYAPEPCIRCSSENTTCGGVNANGMWRHYCWSCERSFAVDWPPVPAGDVEPEGPEGDRG